MRNDFSQVETREISDADLDNVSGGVGVSALGISAGVHVGGVVGSALTTVEGIVPVDGILGTVGAVTGLVGTSGLPLGV